MLRSLSIMRFRGASTHERIHQLDQNVKNSENENGPVNLDTETLIRAFGGKRAFYFYLYFLYPVQLGSSWKQDGGYLCHSTCSFHTPHLHADPHYTHSKFISRTIIACLPESFIMLPW